MGRTKALVEVDGVPMARRVADALEGVGCDPVVVYGGDPVELGPLRVEVVEERFPGAGPVGGVAGAVSWAEGHDDGRGAVSAVLVVACDLPELDRATLGRLLDADRDADVVVAHTGRREPLCALWPLSSAGAVLRAFEDGVRAMHELLDVLSVTEVAVRPRALLNVNRPEDLPEADEPGVHASQG